LSEQFDDMLPDLEGLEEQAARELLERAHQIAQLSQHPGWSVYCDYLVAQTISLQTRILDGRCTSFEDYKEKTGRVAGIRLALEAPNKLDEQIRVMREQAALAEEEEVEFERGS
jgi:hypothetical protein